MQIKDWDSRVGEEFQICEYCGRDIVRGGSGDAPDLCTGCGAAVYYQTCRCDPVSPVVNRSMRKERFIQQLGNQIQGTRAEMKELGKQLEAVLERKDKLENELEKWMKA